MSIRLSCPKCETRWTVPNSSAGKKARCPECETKVLVEEADEPTETGRGKTTLVLVLLALAGGGVVLIGLVVGVFLFLSQNRKSEIATVQSSPKPKLVVPEASPPTVQPVENVPSGKWELFQVPDTKFAVQAPNGMTRNSTIESDSRDRDLRAYTSNWGNYQYRVIVKPYTEIPDADGVTESELDNQVKSFTEENELDSPDDQHLRTLAGKKALEVVYGGQRPMIMWVIVHKNRLIFMSVLTRTGSPINLTDAVVQQFYKSAKLTD